MNPERPTYCWRRLTPEQREGILEERKRRPRPWHGPPHSVDRGGSCLVTAACYEHRHLIGVSPERMSGFETELLETARGSSEQIFAWTVLPNHYHVLVKTRDILGLLQALGRLHGRTSFRWNGEEACRGRQVWHRAAETAMKSERHFWATLNYVLHNAVRHGYAGRWQEWPYSNAAEYLDEVGHDEARRRWREYPTLDYGKDWDSPEL